MLEKKIKKYGIENNYMTKTKCANGQVNLAYHPESIKRLSLSELLH